MTGVLTETCASSLDHDRGRLARARRLTQDEYVATHTQFLAWFATLMSVRVQSGYFAFVDDWTTHVMTPVKNQGRCDCLLCFVSC
mmetsp:Transcript_51481/g.137376  ORF Transcript_51481/g.137376 Transcript_51481/m.137376 type:complete len:85 (-) Transcript_51481:261-515(-)